LATILRNPICNLWSLNLQGIELDDNGASVIARGLASIITLRELTIYHLQGIRMTENGWHAIFAALERSRCRLEELNLSDNCFNEATVFSLVNALQNHITTLKSIVLSGCFERYNSIAGWTSFVSFLQDPRCMLEGLDLNDDYITDEVIDALVNALASNRG
jgi:Ran GTPase-activating protein (RanGAP) involved in mRNA processing and transport